MCLYEFQTGFRYFQRAIVIIIIRPEIANKVPVGASVGENFNRRCAILAVLDIMVIQIVGNVIAS